MTAQIPDTVLFNGILFSIVGISGEGLFDAKLLGLDEYKGEWMMSTACRRGFVCHYVVTDGRLRLYTLDALTGEGSPAIGGVLPIQNRGGVSVRYEGLALDVAFSGGLLLGDGFLAEHYVHMGFHPAWKFTTVHELVFENGVLVAAIDRSAKVADLREKLKESESSGIEMSAEEIVAWIERCFDLRYEDL